MEQIGGWVTRRFIEQEKSTPSWLSDECLPFQFIDKVKPVLENTFDHRKRLKLRPGAHRRPNGNNKWIGVVLKNQAYQTKMILDSLHISHSHATILPSLEVKKTKNKKKL